MNVVPALQRSTVGLVYRLITQHDVDFGPLDLADAPKEKGDGEDCSLTSSSSSTSTGDDEPSNNDGTLSDANDATSRRRAACRHRRSDGPREAQLRSLLPTYLRAVTNIRMLVLAQSRSVWYLLPRWLYRALSPMYREEETTMVPIRDFARRACENAVPGSPLALLRRRKSHGAAPATAAASVPRVSPRLVL